MVDHYPGETAGHRGIDTSIAAADFINASLPQLQRRVIEVIAAAGRHGRTADEISVVLDWPRWRVRPRTSELRAAGRIVDSGQRRPSIAGIASIVWVLPGFLELRS